MDGYVAIPHIYSLITTVDFALFMQQSTERDLRLVFGDAYQTLLVVVAPLA